MHTRDEKIAAFGRLLDVMDALREKCPWNAEQTMESIRRLTEEEVYELSDAILNGETQAVCKEIGDLLYHMVFYARIAQEQELFDIADCLEKICSKMIFRHPHVFGPDAGKEVTAKEIADTWELVKAREKGGNKTVMEGIPDAMPALLKALAMQEKARGCGFDWEKREDVWDKVSEELREVREVCFAESASPNYSAPPEESLQTSASLHPTAARQLLLSPCTPRGRGKGFPRLADASPLLSPDSDSQASSLSETFSPYVVLQGTSSLQGVHGKRKSDETLSEERSKTAKPAATEEQTEEFGDLLFAVLNAARLYGVDPEAALNGACNKFRRRFNYVESGIRSQGRSLADATLSDMDSLWDEAKSKGL